MGIKIEIHSVDDWEAIYVDGHLHSQNHSDRLEDFILTYFLRNDNPEPLTIDSLVHEYHEDDDIARHVQLRGRFPGSLSEHHQIRLEAKRELLRQKHAGVAEAQSELDKLKAEIEAMEAM